MKTEWEKIFNRAVKKNSGGDYASGYADGFLAGKRAAERTLKNSEPDTPCECSRCKQYGWEHSSTR
jgi:hypothetical protein